MINLEQFYLYCLEFYGRGGIYDYAFTREQVEAATRLYISRLNSHYHVQEFCGDTVDRENVRDIILDEPELV